MSVDWVNTDGECMHLSSHWIATEPDNTWELWECDGCGEQWSEPA